MASKQITVKLVVDGTDLDIKMTKAQLKVVQASNAMGASLANLARASKTSFKSAADDTKKFGDTAHAQVTKVQALGGAIRGLDGSMNVRAAERFLASFSGISKLATLAFPVFGLLAISDVLVGLGKRAYEAYDALKQMAAAPQVIANAFRSLNDSLRQNSDDLAVANDRLQIEIDKLSGKPSNGLKLALDQAVASADKLASSLDKDLIALNKLLAENSVPWYAQLLGTAGTGRVNDELGGSNGLGGFAGRINSINDAGGDRIRAARDSGQSTDAAVKDLNSKLAAAYKDEIGRLNKILADAQSPKSITTINRAGRQITSDVDPKTQADLVATTRGAIRSLKYQLDNIGLTSTNDTLNKKKDELSASASADSLTRPFQDKTKELAAQIDGLKDKLRAVGSDGTAEVMAKAYADWREALVKLNDELARHHTQLTAAQSAQLKAQYITFETTKAELEWQESFKKSTTAINDKVEGLQRLTSAIGKGAEAQRAATVEDKLASVLGAKATDLAWMQSHGSDVATLRSGIGDEYDAAQSEKSAQSLDGLQEQITLQNALAVAEGNGAEAVREATLQHRLSVIALTESASSAQKLIAAASLLAAAEEKVKAASTIATLEQEISATNRLTAAQLHGAAAIRDAQVQNRIDQIRRSTPAGAQQDQQILLVQQQSAAQHQLEIAASAMKTGNEYKDQLVSLDEQIKYLEQQKSLGNDSVAIETSLLNLEKERAKTYAEMLNQTNSALNGLKAWFSELQAGGETVAQLISGTLKSAVSSVNEEFAKMLTGQKTDWKRSFQSLLQSGATSGLGVAESSLAKGLGSRGGILGSIGGVLGTGKGTGAAGKPTGTPIDPIYVKMVGSLSGGLPASGSSGSGGGLSIPGTPTSSTGGLSDPGYSITGRDPSGLLLRTPNLFPGATSADAANLSGFDPSELSDLAGGGADASSDGIGDFFDSLSGAFADGGTTSSPGNYLVGEKGPEVLSLGGGSHVTPNNKLGGMGGGTTVNYNIDASGSTDSAGTELRVKNAISASHRKSVHEATLTVQELSKRRPRG